jgi:hypothetical protein
VCAWCAHSRTREAPYSANAWETPAPKIAISRLYKRDPSQGLEPWTPSLPFKSPRRNRRAPMTPYVRQIRAIRANERLAGFPRVDACARVGVRTVCARGWSAGVARGGAPSDAHSRLCLWIVHLCVRAEGAENPSRTSAPRIRAVVLTATPIVWKDRWECRESHRSGLCAQARSPSGEADCRARLSSAWHVLSYDQRHGF